MNFAYIFKEQKIEFSDYSAVLQIIAFKTNKKIYV